MKISDPSPAPQVRAGPPDPISPDPIAPVADLSWQHVPAARSRLVQDVLPWFTSLVAHIALIILGVATASVILAPPPSPLSEEQSAPVTATFHDKGVNVSELTRGKGPADLAELPGQETHPDAANGLARKPGEALDVDAGGGSGPKGEAADRFAVGAGQFSFGNVSGVSRGNQKGDGTGGGGPLARWNPPLRGGGEDGEGIFRQPGGPQARRILYICDATGTMIQKLGALKHELTKSIAQLKPAQAFNVVFFTDGGKYHIADKNGLIVATPERKRQVYAFLEGVTPTGTTDPTPAIAAAFAQKPDLVYFLSDGEFDNLKPYDAVIAEFERSNQDRRARVNTILFETYDQTAEQAMQQIAERHGGAYRYVREADLQ